MQTPEMHCHFLKFIYHAVTKINKASTPKSWHPYLSLNLQKVISVWVLYDIGANISCLSKQIFQAIPQNLHPHQGAKNPRLCHRASSQALHITGIYNFDIQISSKTFWHLSHVIKNLHDQELSFTHTNSRTPLNPRLCLGCPTKSFNKLWWGREERPS